MAIAQANLHTGNAASTTTLSMNTGTYTPQNGNVMVIIAAWNTNATATTPTGWTSLGSIVQTNLTTTLQVFYKVVSGDSGTLSTTLSAASSYQYAWYEFSGVNTSTPINASNFLAAHVTNASIAATPSVSNCYPLAAFATRSQTTPAFSPIGSGWTQDAFTGNAMGFQTQHGPFTGTSAVTASTTYSAQDFDVEAIILLNPPAAANITQVQLNTGASTSASTTCTLPNAPANNNLQMLGVVWRSTATLTLSAGWTLVGTADYTPTFNEKLAIYTRVTTTSGTGNDTGAVTISFSASSAYSWKYYEFSGTDTTTPVNGSTFQTFHGTAQSIVSPTPSVNNCYAVAWFANNLTHTETTGPGTGFTEDNLSTTGSVFMETQHGSASSTAVTATLTWDGTAGTPYCCNAIVLLQTAQISGGSITLSPTSLAIPYNGGSVSFTASRTNFAGTFTASSDDTTVATVVGGGSGSPQTFQVLRQVTTGAGGTCNITVRCGDGVTASLPITIYGDLEISSTSATFQPTGTISIIEPNFFGNVTCTLQNQVTAVPGTPALSQTAGGALAATTYFVKLTYLNSIGETTASAESSLAVSANNLLVVTSPASATNAISYNVYVSTSTGTETKQNASPIAIGTNWTLPTSGLIAGSALPSTNTTALCTVSPVTQAANSNTPVSYTFTPTNVAYGTMTVTFTDTNSVAIQETVLVTGPLTLSTSTLNLSLSGGAQTFTATEAADTASITATSSNTAVATVAETFNGPGNSTMTVTPVAGGTCTITVSDGHGGSGTVSVTVLANLGVSVMSMTFTDPKSATQTSTVSGGTAPYTVSTSDATVATVTISSATVTVTPQGAGTCTITVTDSSSPATTATIAVTVGLPLSVSPSTMGVSAGANQTATASNGRSPYTVGTSNSAVATATVSGSTITVHGVANGTATITVTDADTETATIAVTVGAISLSPTTLSFTNKAAATQTSTASGGTSPYIVSTSNASIATATVAGGVVTVTPQGPGSTSILVVDSANFQNNISVSVGNTTSTAYSITFASPSDNAQQITLSGGTGYTFTNSDTTVASCVLVNGVGIVRPIRAGTCTITIYDSAGDQSVITVTVNGIPSSVPVWTPLGQKQPVKFYDPANTSNSFTPQLNPTSQILKPNNVRKYIETTNATSIISGGREYPPKEISLTWNAMDSSDYEAFRLMPFISPLVYVDNNDQGYLGALVIDTAEQLTGSKKAYHVTASFLVLAPYNGQYTILNQLTPPILSTTATPTTGGYIGGGTVLYFWSTVTTPFGESLVSPALPVTVGNTTNTNYITLSWVAPSSTWYRKTRIYWNTTNTPSTATFLTDTLASQSTTFNVYTNYIGYSTLNPPTFGTAFTGYFSGARWTPTT